MPQEVVEACAQQQWSRAVKLLTAQITEAEEASRSPAEVAMFLCNRAWCYLHLDLNKHALKDATRATQLAPNQPLAFMRQGAAWLALGKKDEAKAAFSQGYQAVTTTGSSATTTPLAASSCVDLEFALRLHSLSIDPSSPLSPTPKLASPSRQTPSANALPASPSSANPPRTPSPASSHRSPATSSAAQNGCVILETGSGDASPRSAKEKEGKLGNGEGATGEARGGASPKEQKKEGKKKGGREGESRGERSGGGDDRGKGSSGGGKGLGGARGSLALDLLISLGINQVNSGKLDDAVKTFNQVLETDGRALGALVGRGTARALQRKLKEAVADFTAAIEIEPRAAEAWKRRAQARAALGQMDEVIEDFTRAFTIDPSSTDVLAERGVVYVKQRNYRAAISDLKTALDSNPKDANAYNFLGLALTGTGACMEGVAAYKKAVALRPDFKDAWVNMGQAYKEYGDAENAAKCYQKVLDVDSSFATVYRYWALLKHGVGDHRGASQMAQKGLRLERSNIELMYSYASSEHAVGEYATAVRTYDEMLGVETDSESKLLQFLGFYQREIALYTLSKHSQPLAHFSLDRDLDPFFKEAWCKKLPPTLLFPGYTTQPVPPSIAVRLGKKASSAAGGSSSGGSSGSGGGGGGGGGKSSGNPEVQRLLELADRIGRLTQYSCPGFHANVRQYRMAGLAAIEIAQAVAAAWEQREEEAAAATAAAAAAAGGTSPASAAAAAVLAELEDGGADMSSFSKSSSADMSLSPVPSSDDVSSLHLDDSLMDDGGSSSGSEAVAGGSRSQEERRKGGKSGGGKGGKSKGGKGGGRGKGGGGSGGKGVSPSAAGVGAGSGAGQGKGGVTTKGVQIKGWRDAYSIAVRWRQLSEPCDPAVWVDMLTEKEFRAGFGSHTPILIGQTKVVRYHANFDRAFAIMKEEMLRSGAVHNAANNRVAVDDPAQKAAVAAAKACEDLYRVVGEDFWIVTPCYSMVDPGKVLEGTRLTLVKTPTGFDFAIRTPGTPSRWADYDAEMTAAWEDLCAVVGEKMQGGAWRPPLGPSMARFQRAVLRLAYYWYNFMPLARGTAMVGYVVALALFLAAQLQVTATIPPKLQFCPSSCILIRCHRTVSHPSHSPVTSTSLPPPPFFRLPLPPPSPLQVDWEAILSSRFETFASAVMPWLSPSVTPLTDPTLPSFPFLTSQLPTVASAVAALSSPPTSSRAPSAARS
ncbi:unnamed protein product [Closterium sp. NIES-54]